MAALRTAAAFACASLGGACGPAGPAADACPPGSAREADGLCHLPAPGDTGEGGGAGAAAPQPAWTAPEAEAAARAALALGLPEPVRVRDLYAEALTHIDGGCPRARRPDPAAAHRGLVRRPRVGGRHPRRRARHLRRAARRGRLVR